MIIIKIAKESIKKNPKAGRTKTIVNESKEIKISGYGKNIPYILNYNNFQLTNREINGSGFSKWTGYLLDEKIIDKLNKKEDGINVDVTYNQQVYNHKPLPEFLYEYENTIIECPECKEKFMSNDFDSESDDDGGYSNTVCVNCGHWIEDVVYENINDVKIDNNDLIIDLIEPTSEIYKHILSLKK